MQIVRNIFLFIIFSTIDFSAPSNDYIHEIAKGSYGSKKSLIHLHGINRTTSTTETIWSQGGEYNWLDTATLVELSSSDNSDAVTITLTGLDSSYAVTSENVTVSGNSIVTSTVEFLRINSAENATDTEFDGDISIAIEGASWSSGVAQNTTEVLALLDALDQKSSKAVYTVPAGKKFIIYDIFLSSDDTNEAECILYIREFGKVFMPEFRDIIFKTRGLASTKMIPIIAPAKSDIDLQCIQSSGNAKINAEVFGVLE